MAKLRLADRQVARFDRESATHVDAGDALATFVLRADPLADDWDPEAAAAVLSDALAMGTVAAADVLAAVARAPADARAAFEARHDVMALSARAARDDGPAAAFAHAMRLRDRAAAPGDLAEAVAWMRRAAEDGVPDAMVELALMTALGAGAPPDAAEALRWLDRATRAGAPRAAGLAATLRAGSGL